MIKITASQQQITGVSFYRLYQPLITLSHKMEDYKVIMFNPEYMEDALSEEFDIYFSCSAAFELQLETIKLLKKYNRKCIIDYDDSENVHPSNPMYVLYGTEECKVELSDGQTILWENNKTEIEVFGQVYKFDIERNKKNRLIQEEIKREASALVTTTNDLRNELLKYNKNVYIAPNMIDFTLYKPKENDNKNEVRVGWMLSSSHLDDLVSIKPELIKCLKDNPTMKLVIMCFGLSNEFNDFPQDRIEIVPGVNINKGYHNIFNELKLDIGLCHLEDTEFNHMKSPIKWAEYSAMEIPTIATNIVYGRHLTDRHNVYLYSNPKEFRHNIKYLIDRPELRKKVGKQAKLDAIDMYGFDTVMPIYEKIFKEVCESNDK